MKKNLRVLSEMSLVSSIEDTGENLYSVEENGITLFESYTEQAAIRFMVDKFYKRIEQKNHYLDASILSYA